MNIGMPRRSWTFDVPKIATFMIATSWCFQCLPLRGADEGQNDKNVAESKRSPLPDDVAATPFPSDAVEPTSLGDTDFSIRRRSTMELWRDRDRYRESVLESIRSDDLEMAERSRWVRDRWLRGILADTSPDMVKRLSELKPEQAIELLLETGHFASATIAVTESLGTLDYETITNRIAITLDARFPVYARHAIEHGKQQELLDFLTVATTTTELAICRRDWANLIGLRDTLPEPNATRENDATENKTREIGDQFQSWPKALAERTRCLLHLLEGDQEAALLVAKASDQRSAEQDASPQRNTDSVQPFALLRIVRMILSQWPEMAAESATAAAAIEQQTPNIKERSQALRLWSDALIAASRCDAIGVQEQAVDGLRLRTSLVADQPSPDTALPEDVRKLVWRTLLIHGYVDEAIAWIQTDDPKDAALIASAASRSSEAIQWLHHDFREIDTWLLDRIDAAVEAQRKLHDEMTSGDSKVTRDAMQRAPSGLAEEVEALFALTRFLLSVGRDDAAWQIVDRLSIKGLSCKRDTRSTSYLVRDYVLLSLMLTNRTDWIIRLGFRAWETEPSIVSQSLVARVTIVDDYRVLMILSDLIRMHSPETSVTDAFQTACEIARAETIDRQQHAHWIPILARTLRDGSLRKRVNQDAQLDVFFQPHNQTWSDLFIAYGRPDLAEPLLRRRAATGDLEAMHALAQDYRITSENGDDSLDKTLQSIWDAIAAPQNSESRFRGKVTTAIDAIAGQTRLAMDRGDRKTADQLLFHLAAMACSPSTSTRQHIADAMADLGQWNQAESIYQTLLTTTAVSSDETRSLIDLARGFQGFALRATKHDLERTESAVPSASDAQGPARKPASDQRLRVDAVKWFDMAFAGTLTTFEYRPQLYLIYPRLIARERLELDLAVRLATTEGASSITDESLVKQVKHLQRLDRLDITTAESLLPTLREANLIDLADQFIEQILDAAEEHMRAFPSDAMLANNVAWAAAMNDYGLERALELSRQAVTLQPDSAIYRDTLAEILARMNRPREAWMIEKACILDDPSQWHLHEQVQRFQNLLK